MRYSKDFSPSAFKPVSDAARNPHFSASHTHHRLNPLRLENISDLCMLTTRVVTSGDTLFGNFFPKLMVAAKTKATEAQLSKVGEIGVDSVSLTLIWRDIELARNTLNNTKLIRIKKTADLAKKHNMLRVARIHLHLIPEWLIDGLGGLTEVSPLTYDGSLPAADEKMVEWSHPSLLAEAKRFSGLIKSFVERNFEIVYLGIGAEGNTKYPIDHGGERLFVFNKYCLEEFRKWQIQQGWAPLDPPSHVDENSVAYQRLKEWVPRKLMRVVNEVARIFSVGWKGHGTGLVRGTRELERFAQSELYITEAEGLNWLIMLRLWDEQILDRQHYVNLAHTNGLSVMATIHIKGHEEEYVNRFNNVFSLDPPPDSIRIGRLHQFVHEKGDLTKLGVKLTKLIKK